jgi:hypothetical protein
MTDTLSERTGTNEIPLTIGDAVCISRGALCGLRGTVHGFASSRRCVLAIEGLADGVQIVIGRESIVLSGFAAADADGAPATQNTDGN